MTGDAEKRERGAYLSYLERVGPCRPLHKKGGRRSPRIEVVLFDRVRATEMGARTWEDARAHFSSARQGVSRQFERATSTHGSTRGLDGAPKKTEDTP